MPAFGPEYATRLWYEALRTEHGIRFSVEEADVSVIINRLYDARNDIGDERLKALSIKPYPGEIWIYHNPEASLT